MAGSRISTIIRYCFTALGLRRNGKINNRKNSGIAEVIGASDKL
jgi:hypothetical protein